jgi:hypothetical protein
MRGTFSQSEKYRNGDTLSQRSGDCQLTQECNVSAGGVRYRVGIQAFPFYPIAEAEKVCNRHSREFLPPPTNG